MIVLAGLSTCLGFLMMPDSAEGLDETDSIPATADHVELRGLGCRRLCECAQVVYAAFRQHNDLNAQGGGA
jgi:hypothetical protein